MRSVRLVPPAETALPLAMLRVAIAVIALVATEPEVARVVASRPRALWAVPEGLAALVALAPPTPTSVDVAIAALRVSAALALIGLFARAACAALALAMFYVFGVAQLAGAAMHDMHLVWFATVCALAPSGRALSLDAWSDGACVAGPAATRGDAISWAVGACRLWLGLVYFFPGVHKLARGGLAWVASDNLRNQIYFKWFEMGGGAPWPRVDRFPALMHLAAAGVVAFELSMPLLVLWRRTRLLAFALALSFHVLAGHFMKVPYPALAVCAVVLLPGERIRAWWVSVSRRVRERSRARAEPSAPERGAARPSPLLVLVSGVMTVAIVVQGARGQTESFPFACYPTFASIAPDQIVDLAVDVTSADGSTRTFRMPRPRSQDAWGFVWRTAGLYGDALDPARLRAFERLVAPRAPTATRVAWVREAYDVRPEAYGAPPVRRDVMFTEAR